MPKPAPALRPKHWACRVCHRGGLPSTSLVHHRALALVVHLVQFPRMGQSRKRKIAFFHDHPWCCFCGGSKAATTIDHVPNRACFPGRQAPEGYEFPACADCQSETRLDEIGFATLVFSLAHESVRLDKDAVQKLFSGLQNNLPEAARFRALSTNDKRKAARRLGLALPAGATYLEAPFLGINEELRECADRYICKIARALYYKHLGSIAPANAFTHGMWLDGKMPANSGGISAWAETMPSLFRGTRSNVDLGNYFTYRTNFSAEEKAFAVIGQFASGMAFSGICAAGEVGEKLEALEDELRNGSAV